MSKVLVNGRAFDFVQITTTILGVPMPSVSAISYVRTKEIVDNFGAGDEPVSRGEGPKSTEASITLSMNDVEALRSAAPNGDLLDLPAFEIVVVFGNAQDPQRHVLKNVQFKDDGVEATQGDTDISRSFSLAVSHVAYR